MTRRASWLFCGAGPRFPVADTTLDAAKPIRSCSTAFAQRPCSKLLPCAVIRVATAAWGALVNSFAAIVISSKRSPFSALATSLLLARALAWSESDPEPADDVALQAHAPAAVGNHPFLSIGLEDERLGIDLHIDVAVRTAEDDAALDAAALDDHVRIVRDLSL